jgi:hypothetical protein
MSNNEIFISGTDILTAFIRDIPPNIANMTAEQARMVVVRNLKENAIRSRQHGTGPSMAADIDKFYQLLSYAIAEQQKKDGDPNPIPLVENFPATYSDKGRGGFKETLTFGLRRREPGTFSQDPPFSGKKNYKPILREAFPDPQNPGYEILVFGLWFDNLVELKCWCNTNKEANTRALWLESLMLKYAWYFRFNGIQQILYGGREHDENIQQENISIQVRTLLYYMRTEKLFNIREKSIDELILNVHLANELSSDSS